MGIISRFSDIMKSNINAVLDKFEDPSKMIDQMLRDCSEQLAEVKKDTAGVIAEEKAAKRRLDECQANIDKYTRAAQNALKSGKEEDAKTLIAQKQQYETTYATLSQAYETAKSNSDKMRQMYKKLESDIAALNARRVAVKANVSMAKSQQAVNKSIAKMGSSSSTSAFERMEAKAQNMLDRAEAEAELNVDSGSVADLANKYSYGSTSDVDDELARMKAEMGL